MVPSQEGSRQKVLLSFFFHSILMPRFEGVDRQFMPGKQIMLTQQSPPRLWNAMGSGRRRYLARTDRFRRLGAVHRQAEHPPETRAGAHPRWAVGIAPFVWTGDLPLFHAFWSAIGRRRGFRHVYSRPPACVGVNCGTGCWRRTEQWHPIQEGGSVLQGPIRFTSACLPRE